MSDVGDSTARFPAWLDRPAAWIKDHEFPLLIGGILLQLTVLVGMILLRVAIMLRGDTILLQVVPVDPRDVFRGDYVVLSYQCSRLPSQGIPGLRHYGDYDSREDQGRTVYVTLLPEPDGKHWRPAEYFTERPKKGIYLRGQVEGWRVLYGIESFYVQEGKGHEYEHAAASRKLWAKISVSSGGEAALRDLLIE
jgi:uncharacterized membrane-anchored protein